MTKIREFIDTASTAELAAFIADCLPRIKQENDMRELLKAMARTASTMLVMEAAAAAGDRCSPAWDRAWDKEQARQLRRCDKAIRRMKQGRH